ncbi:hypothetical protein Hamer_G017109 [Homarus americanus]|uniref:Uncharacterized protein n=1 Tax=Homarus americanus TaxID=6706 RepID=A0A8J5K5X5_HOMAM|nr:hypothetical protein Hamer_G017109 [Homarus americanus]
MVVIADMGPEVNELENNPGNCSTSHYKSKVEDSHPNDCTSPSVSDHPVDYTYASVGVLDDPQAHHSNLSTQDKHRNTAINYSSFLSNQEDTDIDINLSEEVPFNFW